MFLPEGHRHAFVVCLTEGQRHLNAIEDVLEERGDDRIFVQFVERLMRGNIRTARTWSLGVRFELWRAKNQLARQDSTESLRSTIEGQLSAMWSGLDDMQPGPRADLVR